MESSLTSCLRPSGVHTPGAVSHELVGFTRTVTSPKPDGSMCSVQPLFCPGFSRLAFSMLAPVTSNSPFWIVRKLKVAGSSLRGKRISNAVPSCSAGTPENDAVNGIPGTVAETACSPVKSGAVRPTSWWAQASPRTPVSSRKSVQSVAPMMRTLSTVMAFRSSRVLSGPDRCWREARRIVRWLAVCALHRCAEGGQAPGRVRLEVVTVGGAVRGGVGRSRCLWLRASAPSRGHGAVGRGRVFGSGRSARSRRRGPRGAVRSEHALAFRSRPP